MMGDGSYPALRTGLVWDTPLALADFILFHHEVALPAARRSTRRLQSNANAHHRLRLTTPCIDCPFGEFHIL
jgi:hypothetical protein